MLEELLIAAVLSLAAGAVYGFFESLWGSPSNHQELPASLTAEMSDYDKEMADRSRELIRECFCRDGNNVMDSVRQMNADERLEAARDFSDRLARLNGLDHIKTSFFQDDNIANCGGYHDGTKTVFLNIRELMWDGDDEAFESGISNFIDTIVHEQRHAVQWRAIREKGFWHVEDARRMQWANNYLPQNYIVPSVDIRGYRMQPVEKDAFTYAAMVLRGVE